MAKTKRPAHRPKGSGMTFPEPRSESVTFRATPRLKRWMKKRENREKIEELVWMDNREV